MDELAALEGNLGDYRNNQGAYSFKDVNVIAGEAVFKGDDVIEAVVIGMHEHKVLSKNASFVKIEP